VLAHEQEHNPYRTCYYENATTRSLQAFPVRPCHGMLPFARARLKTFARPTSFAPRIVCLTSRCSTRFSSFLCPLCVRAGRSYPCASLVLTVSTPTRTQQQRRLRRDHSASPLALCHLLPPPFDVGSGPHTPRSDEGAVTSARGALPPSVAHSGASSCCRPRSFKASVRLFTKQHFTRSRRCFSLV
jgi:hypothetical protein